MSERPTFHCALCNVAFHDSEAATRHKASRRHRLATGQLEREKKQYKADEDVVAEDIRTICRQKREREVTSLSSEQYVEAPIVQTANNSSATADTKGIVTARGVGVVVESGDHRTAHTASGSFVKSAQRTAMQRRFVTLAEVLSR